MDVSYAIRSDQGIFDEEHVLHKLKHYLPAQSPLKDFVHHNTLHAFQHLKFHKGLQLASSIFGYKVYLRLDEYRSLHHAGKINKDILERIIAEKKGRENLNKWKEKLLEQHYDTSIGSRIGFLRENWKSLYQVNLDKEVHPLLFRIIGSYLDQGISIWKFPMSDKGFLASVRELERYSFVSFFKKKRARQLLLHSPCKLKSLLKILTGDEQLYEQYLFDQQFAHPGWSGMASVLEDQPQGLLERKKISLHDFIALELLLEIDALDSKFGESWLPLAQKLDGPVSNIFTKSKYIELFEVYALWQEAYEWTYYDEVLRGLQLCGESTNTDKTSFQALFCIDDRGCSLRRYIEKFAPDCKTYSTAGFFNVEFYFQPEHGKFHTKVCPAPLTPAYLIKESEAKLRHQKDAHFNRHSLGGLFGGWIVSQTMGFWSAIKLAGSIFKPTETPAMVSSFKHMDKQGKLGIVADHPPQKVHDLQLGFTINEMADRMESMFKSIGLVKDFSPLVYIIGHGASSVNNTHYAGYDCGACSGRSGSVNARVAAFMANHLKVREILGERGTYIPPDTQFLGGLHDTTRDEIEFYDEDELSSGNKERHRQNVVVFNKSLNYNAWERSRRFLLINTKDKVEKVHEQVKLRALSLFEPRPEWNHATNALCIVGRRETNKQLFLDRRAFLNSYDYRVDPEGVYLLNILKAVAPVCCGINLEYYFSRMDNYRLGAGSKLPHNVMGLIGVANGMEGDLRPGLPMQMVNIHEPLRLMAIVEHFPDVVLNTIQQHKPTYEWFINEWAHLAVIHPETKELYYFKDGKQFTPYQTITREIKITGDLEKIIGSGEEDLPVYLLK